MNNISKYALINSLLTLAYIVLIATFLSHAQAIFGPGPDNKFITPIAMMLLFVFSAGLTGSLVLGRPVMWYLDGKKKEAVTLFAYTLGGLFICAVIAFCVLFAVR